MSTDDDEESKEHLNKEKLSEIMLYEEALFYIFSRWCCGKKKRHKYITVICVLMLITSCTLLFWGCDPSLLCGGIPENKSDRICHLGFQLLPHLEMFHEDRNQNRS